MQDVITMCFPAKPEYIPAIRLCVSGIVSKLDFDGEISEISDEKSFVSLLVISGSGSLESCGETLSLQKGDSIFIPANTGEYKLSGKLEIIETRI